MVLQYTVHYSNSYLLQWLLHLQYVYKAMDEWVMWVSILLRKWIDELEDYPLPINNAHS